MELSIKLLPNQQSIHLIDEVMNTLTNSYNLPNKKEICFVVHELIINSVEAMEELKKNEVEIEFQAHLRNGIIEISVIDYARGIEEDQLATMFEINTKHLTSSDRGRGLFFVKNMVDDISFYQFKENKFLVKVTKKLISESIL